MENKDDKKKSFQEFKRDHWQETEKHINSLKEKADFIIENNGNLKNFHAKIEKVIKKIINNKK
jgi:dephospho-CoA kinase